MADLESLPRKELQALAKANGIKANLATVKIIAELRALQSSEESGKGGSSPPPPRTSPARKDAAWAPAQDTPDDVVSPPPAKAAGPEDLQEAPESAGSRKSRRTSAAASAGASSRASLGAASAAASDDWSCSPARSISSYTPHVIRKPASPAVALSPTTPASARASAPAQAAEPAPPSELASSILSRVSNLRKLLQKTPPPAGIKAAPSTPASSKKQKTPPPPPCSASNTPSRPRLSLHETIMESFTPKQHRRRESKTPHNTPAAPLREEEEPVAGQDFETDDNAACLLHDNNELDLEPTSRHALRPPSAKKPGLSGGSAAGLMDRLQQLKQRVGGTSAPTTAQHAPRTPKQQPAGCGGAEEDGAELLMGFSPLPVTP